MNEISLQRTWNLCKWLSKQKRLVRLQSRLRLLNFLQRAPVCRLPLHAPVGGAGGAKAVALRELVRVMPSA